MEKKELSNIINDILSPFGYKKKGNYWVINGGEITKMVNLQKSQFSNSFYINYGYILNSIPLNNLMMHIFKGFGSTNTGEQQRITDLLNLENNVTKEERERELKELMTNNLLVNFHKVDTEMDLLQELKTRPHLNDIPLVVKKHFNLPA